MRQDALLYDTLLDEAVQCNLCSHRCLIRTGGRGICRVRENTGGKLYTLDYGNLIAANVDPVEKKPLYHFYPGSKAYSIAAPGCNFRCEWCQNWQISQMAQEKALQNGLQVTPEKIVKMALQAKCRSIAYTYTEPTIFFEYSYDTARLARHAGIKNIYVTNGFMTPEMLEMFNPYLDAVNVDIKAFKDETYRKLIGGRLEPVLESCRLMRKLGIWVEITTLIIPGINDDPDELEGIARFICEELGPDTPWHLSRFYPQYKMQDRNATDETILNETKAMGRAIGLHYVYLGNVVGPTNTYCKQCGHELISRMGYSIRLSGIDVNGHCKICQTKLDGVGFVS